VEASRGTHTCQGLLSFPCLLGVSTLEKSVVKTKKYVYNLMHTRKFSFTYVLLLSLGVFQTFDGLKNFAKDNFFPV